MATPNPSTSSPWLAIAGRLGRVACAFLIAASFTMLFAPVFFLADLPSYVKPDGTEASRLLALLSDPARLLATADFVAILGMVILASTLVLILLGLLRGDKRVSAPTVLLGVATLVCLVASVALMLYSQGRARGTIASVDAVAATGGWGVASGLLLGASLAFLLFTTSLDRGRGRLRLASLRWPIYAAVNLLGSVAIAGFFSALAAGVQSLDVFTLGLVLKVTLIPVLGVVAYRDLRDRFPLWANVAVNEAPRARVFVTGAVRPAPGTLPLPPPPPPDD